MKMKHFLQKSLEEIVRRNRELEQHEEERRKDRTADGWRHGTEAEFVISTRKAG